MSDDDPKPPVPRDGAEPKPQHMRRARLSSPGTARPEGARRGPTTVELEIGNIGRRSTPGTRRPEPPPVERLSRPGARAPRRPDPPPVERLSRPGAPVPRLSSPGAESPVGPSSPGLGAAAATTARMPRVTSPGAALSVRRSTPGAKRPRPPGPDEAERERRRRIAAHAREFLVHMDNLARQLGVHDTSNEAVKRSLRQVIQDVRAIQEDAGDLSLVFADGHAFVNGVWTVSYTHLTLPTKA